MRRCIKTANSQYLMISVTIITSKVIVTNISIIIFGNKHHEKDISEYILV